MSNDAIPRRWEVLQAAGRIALIPYLTAGYPTRAASLEALRMVAEAGADFVEVGLPFSDPVADGPIIQRSTQVALEGGMTVRGALDLVREARVDVPVIAFGYLNPLLAYGVARFLDEAAEAGVSGLLSTDLPLGEDPEVEALVRGGPLARIALVAPTTSSSRLATALADAEGFVYLIARLGVTGARTMLDAGVKAAVHRVRAACRLPVALGFGIREGRQAADAAALADGVVVGSALVERLADGVERARDLMLELRDALDGARR